MKIHFTDKKVFDVTPLAGLMREGEIAAEIVEITGPRMIDLLDVGALTWTMVGNYSDYDEFASQGLSATPGEDGQITMTWVPSELFAAHPGGIDLILEGTDSGGTVVIKLLASSRLTIARAKRKYGSVVISQLEKMLSQVATSVATAVQAAADAASAAAAMVLDDVVSKTSAHGVTNRAITAYVDAETERATAAEGDLLGKTATAADAAKLGGQLPDYYSTSSAVSVVSALVGQLTGVPHTVYGTGDIFALPAGNRFFYIGNDVPANGVEGMRWCYGIKIDTGPVGLMMVCRPGIGKIWITEKTGSPAQWSSWKTVVTQT